VRTKVELFRFDFLPSARAMRRCTEGLGNMGDLRKLRKVSWHAVRSTSPIGTVPQQSGKVYIDSEQGRRLN
jgi:hypothetical protein